MKTTQAKPKTQQEIIAEQKKEMTVFIKDFHDSMSLENGLDFEISNLEYYCNYFNNKLDRFKGLKQQWEKKKK